jgi:hypothetical protein
MSVLRGLKEERIQEKYGTPANLGLSPKKQGLSEIALNYKPVIINSEEQINRRCKNSLKKYDPAVTSSFADEVRSSFGSQPAILNIS